MPMLPIVEGDSIGDPNEGYPFPRCYHGNCLLDGTNEILSPSCGCQMEVKAENPVEYLQYCQKDLRRTQKALTLARDGLLGYKEKENFYEEEVKRCLANLWWAQIEAAYYLNRLVSNGRWVRKFTHRITYSVWNYE